MTIERWMRATTATVALGAVALGATACDGDSATSAAAASTDAVQTTSDAGRPIADREQWCALLAVVDNQMAAAERLDAPFEVQQHRFENVRVHVRRLESGLDLVDGDAREDVAALVRFTDDLLTTIVDAPDERSAEERVDAVYDAAPDAAGFRAAAWISSTCGVNIA
jgi:hypothetical protein